MEIDAPSPTVVSEAAPVDIDSGAKAMTDDDDDDAEPRVESAKAAAETIRLRTSDGDVFTIERKIADMMTTLKLMLKDVAAAAEHAEHAEEESEDYDIPIEFPNISTATMKKVVEFCEYHYDNPDPNPIPQPDENRLPSPEMMPWDKTFIDLPDSDIFALILAANYLDVPTLLHLGCKKIALIIKGMTSDEIRARFNITNEFEPGEREQLEADFAWCNDL